jgi:chromosome segregation protein
MRLEKIKISGFKSFVDPTTVNLPSNLVGVIGPNGCGKSNVIDAVRWVMGETSAKMLRGESMADVIFNGSTSRKPVGAASIELIFDNSDGTVGGEYAQYNQISIKRKVTRDGQSNYFLNGVRCRRRDITDIFLGTGLGPRSYSIIEQGMISRFVEAKPEDLRNFLEEAAGISKYKERRRETENRISHTRENLDRLTDLREEVAKQLQHLERQAATAEKYKVLKQEERQKKAELLVLKLKKLDDELASHDRRLAEQENELQKITADQRRNEADAENNRQKQHDANDTFNQVQGRFYSIGADIARLEEAIQYAKTTRRQQENELSQVESSLEEARDHETQDSERLQELQILLEQEEPTYMARQERDEDLASQLLEADQAMHNWQQEWDDFNQKATEPAQLAQIERTRINHIEQQEQQYQKRLDKIREEKSRLDTTVFEQEIEDFTDRSLKAEEQLAQSSARLQTLLKGISEKREHNRENNQQLDVQRTARQKMQGQLASLEALQREVLGKKENHVNRWLEQQSLDGASRLLEKITVSKQWQQAVETVLAGQLQSICVDQFDSVAEAITELEKGQVSLFDTSSASSTSYADNSLLKQVQSDFSLAAFLGPVKTAASLSDAMNLRSTLADHESVITAEGIWIGRSWLRYNRQADQQGGMIAREEEIKQLRLDIRAASEKIDSLEEEVNRFREEIRTAEHDREQLQAEVNRLNRELGDHRANIASRKARVENINNRLHAMQEEYADIENQIHSGKTLSEESRERLHQALHEMETHGARRDELIGRRDQMREKQQTVREEASSNKQRTHELALKLESMRSSLQALRQNLDRNSGQLEQLQRRREALQETLGSAEKPLADQQQELENNLEKRLAVESELTEARRYLEEIDHAVRELEQQRVQIDNRLQGMRETLTQSRMQRQETQIRQQSVKEQLTETGFEQAALLETLDENASIALWQEEVESLEKRIARLGAINLAAIDEFREQSERMEYLNRQNDDITESLETLENAIRKIDRETRTLFKQTYDTVDAGLKELFPKLFGGGHAYLQMIGDDVLDAGVAIMARPPGKRNSSIHLLSGGEKALTAVALVFAIFQINPAPFCMLDEVDAPLDDANVGRFCTMVKEMSEKVQFVFITHNKVTMEIANQLMGVTMHEPGVSRLVSVDIDEAAKLAVV